MQRIVLSTMIMLFAISCAHTPLEQKKITPYTSLQILNISSVEYTSLGAYQQYVYLTFTNGLQGNVTRSFGTDGSISFKFSDLDIQPILGGTHIIRFPHSLIYSVVVDRDTNTITFFLNKRVWFIILIQGSTMHMTFISN